MIASDGRAVGINDPAFYQLSLSKFLTVPTPIWVMALFFIVFGSCSTGPSSARTPFDRRQPGGLAAGPRRRCANAHLDLRPAGLVCAVAGVLLASRITSGQPNAATALELSVISACVLGGVSLAGGRATMTGVVVGVLIMGIAENVMNLLNIQAFYQYVVRGLILLIAVPPRQYALCRRQAREGDFRHEGRRSLGSQSLVLSPVTEIMPAQTLGLGYAFRRAPALVKYIYI